MSRSVWVGLVGTMMASVLGAGGVAAQSMSESVAVGLVGRAADLMGGEERLRSVARVSMEMTTTWLRTGFRSVPFTDRPSYEEHTDTRDYSIDAWRNTRRFPNGAITNIIRDSISVTDMGRGFQPLSDAYVDERDELFVYTPDRLILALLDADEIRAEADTLLGEEPHHRVRARLGPGHGHVADVDVFFHAGTELPTMLRFVAPHPSDFGLVQWGAMEVEVWYSAWSSFGDVHIPRQWDIRRVGVPYKRLTVRRAVFDPVFEADSFAVSDSLRRIYAGSPAARPMHEARVIESVRRPVSSVALFSPFFGVPTGAVVTSEGLLMLGAGQAPFNYQQAVAELVSRDFAEPSLVLIAPASPGNGGVVGAARDGVPVLASVAAEPFVRAMLDNEGLVRTPIEVVRDTREIGRGEDRVVLARVDIPDTPGALMLYQPANGWLWVPDASSPLHIRIARERAEERGWVVRIVGWQREAWEASVREGQGR